MPPPALSLLPQAPAVVAGHGRAALLTGDGELLLLAAAEAAKQLEPDDPPLLVHAPATWRRLGVPPRPCLDLLELFAFVLPARPVPPTPRGLAAALDLPLPGSVGAGVALLPRIAGARLGRLAPAARRPPHRGAARLAPPIGPAGRPWGRAAPAA